MAHYEAKARAVGRLGVAIGAMAGAAVGSVPLSPLRAAWPIPSNFGFATILGGLFVGVMIGYVIGDGRAQLYHRMAEQARLQLLARGAGLRERRAHGSAPDRADRPRCRGRAGTGSTAAATTSGRAAKATAGRGGSPPVPPHGRHDREALDAAALAADGVLARRPNPRRRGRRAPRRRAPGRALRPRPPRGARARRAANRFDGSSTASSVPSSAHADSTSPSPTVPNPWWWCDLTGARSPSSVPRRLPSFTSTSWSAKTPGVCLCFSSPTTSGRCWTRSPPRATFSTCEPRHTASTGMSRSSAAVSSASSPRSLSGRVPIVSGCASWPYSAGSMSEPPEKRIPSRTSSVSSIPSSLGGTSSGRPPAASI